MYTSFSAKNFLCLKELALADLARFNLITGRGNVGKTALLKALWAHAGGLLGVLQSCESPHMYHDPQQAVVTASTNEQGERSMLLVKPIQVSQDGDTLHFEYRRGDEVKQYVAHLHGRTIVKVEPDMEASPRGIFYLDDSRLEAAHEAVLLKRSAWQGGKLPLTLARCVEPRLHSIVYRYTWPGIVFDIGGKNYPFPVVGSGMKRALAMGTRIFLGGVALIENIEASLHPSAFQPICEVLARGIEFYKRQVFATTQSVEFIAAAHEAFSRREPYNLRVYRLDRIGEDSIRVITYDRETIAASLNCNLEIR